MRSKHKKRERKGRYVVNHVQRLGWDRDMQRSTRQMLKEDLRKQIEDCEISSGDRA